MIQLLNFTTLNKTQKELVLSWRNHPDIRKWMMDDNVITLENHLHFIDLLNTKTDRCYFLVQKDFEYIGVIDLTAIHMDYAELGIYANPSMCGVGNILMNSLIDYAKELGITKLVANVYSTNVRAKNLYERFHFIQTKQIQDHNKKINTLELTL